MKKTKILSMVITLTVMLALCFAIGTTVFAAGADTQTADAQAQSEQIAEETEDNSVGTKAIAAAIVVGIASALGSVAMGIAIAKSAESMARQPEASGKINSAMMLGLVFIETLIIYALIVAILIIFVL